ncbi:copper chaperone PCu(A)C [Rhizorhapis sp.]|uniref:copper chaperone PCu(A)C n=1 Tax=Rhizorhapis sp. TaxID=1968842 RepID=UPI002B459EB7|nr:copper chaperone PCu(A)C [Rhizorhapis sp.]HKR16264.1 copper chaperone PCu(A)C [Rhizorhapis sp.]
MIPHTAQRLPAIFLVGLSLMLAACGQQKILYVDQAWVRLSANQDTPSGGYFTVHGGEEDVRLLSVISPTVLRIELHQSLEKNGMMSMEPVNGVDIPARTDVVFGPGGKHLMIWGINPAIRKQGKLPLTFIFSNGDRIIYDAVLRQPGASEAAPAPKDEHKGH